MLKIRSISSEEKDIIDNLVSIHLDTFQGFFLTFMGRGFLKLMYSSYADYKDSDILLAFENGRLVGFIAYSCDISGLYKYMIKKKLILFMWYSLGAFLRKPTVFMRLVRAFLKPSETKREEKYIELASIGIAPDLKSKGIGSRLIDELKNRVDFGEYAYITLETDAVDNAGANHFYKKNGFAVERKFETNEGRKMYEYRYSVEEEKV